MEAGYNFRRLLLVQALQMKIFSQCCDGGGWMSYWPCFFEVKTRFALRTI